MEIRREEQPAPPVARTSARSPVRFAAVAMGIGAAAACFPSYEFRSGVESDGGSSGGQPPAEAGSADDARASDGAPLGDGADAPYAPDGAPLPPVPASLIDGVGVDTETGNAQQQHVIFATNSGRYWLFYIDAEPNLVKTRWSTDFAHWTDGASLTLPMGHGGEGRNFSVAYRDFGGHDVVHVATSLHDEPLRIVYDTRATIAAGVITFGTPVVVHDINNTGAADAGPKGEPGCEPDGCSVAIGADGHVYVATAWVAVPGCCECDSNVATSAAIDDGTSWSGGFVEPLTHYTVPATSNAHQLVAFSSGNMIDGWEAADDDPATNVRWGTKSAGVWSPDEYYKPTWNVFLETDPKATQAENDWSFCRIDDAHVHAVRRRYGKLGDGGLLDDSVFEHYVWNGGGWTFSASMTAEKGLAGSGVVLLTNGHGLLAAAIADDGSGSVRYATWSGGSTWSGWSTLAGADGGAIARNYLSGSGCGDPVHPALIWTEGSAPPYRVAGAPVATLIP